MQQIIFHFYCYSNVWFTANTELSWGLFLFQETPLYQLPKQGQMDKPWDENLRVNTFQCDLQSKALDLWQTGHSHASLQMMLFWPSLTVIMSN